MSDYTRHERAAGLSDATAAAASGPEPDAFTVDALPRASGRSGFVRFQRLVPIAGALVVVGGVLWATVPNWTASPVAWAALLASPLLTLPAFWAAQRFERRLPTRLKVGPTGLRVDRADGTVERVPITAPGLRLTVVERSRSTGPSWIEWRGPSTGGVLRVEAAAGAELLRRAESLGYARAPGAGRGADRRATDLVRGRVAEPLASGATAS